MKKKVKNQNVTKRTRRDNNTGSIHKRKDGRWVAVVSLGKNEMGKPIRKCLYGKSSSEVAFKMVPYVNGNYSLMELSHSHSFLEILKDWLLVYKTKQIQDSTIKSRLRMIDAYLKPNIEDVKLIEITKFHIQSLFNIFKEKNVPKSVYKNTKELLSQFFTFAIDNDMISINPMPTVKIKHSNDRENKYKALTIEERETLLETFYKDFLNYDCI